MGKVKAKAKTRDKRRNRAMGDPEIATVAGPILLLLFVRIGQTRLLDNRVSDIASQNGMEAA